MNVNIGDQFESNDKRDAGRRVEVVEFKGTTAVIRNMATMKKVAISIVRLCSKRWEKVANNPPPEKTVQQADADV